MKAVISSNKIINFNEDLHEYTIEGHNVPSVTQILATTVFPDKYSNVDEETLKKASIRGKMIHKEIEDYINNNEEGFTSEFYNFKDIVKDNNLKDLSSETIVSNGEIAGTIDLFARMEDKNILADIKTTYELDKEYVSYQLSFYRYILKSYGVEIDELYAIWLRGNEYKFEKVEIKSDEVLLEILSDFQNGTKFELLPSTLQTIPLDKQNAFKSILEQMRDMEKKSKEFKKAILKEMEDRGIDKVQIDNLVITRKAPYMSKRVDSEKMKQDGIYDKYTKDSLVNSSLLISFKEE